MKKRITAFILAFVLFINAGSVEVLAQNSIDNSSSALKTISNYYINPLYEDVITEEDLVKSVTVYSADYGVSLLADVTYHTDPESAAEEIRPLLVERQEKITFGYMIPEESFTSQGLGEIGETIFEEVCEHNGNAAEGDYILWHFGGYYIDAHASGWNDDQTCYVSTITYTFTYDTTKEQEDAVDEAVEDLLEKLAPTGTSYEKVKKVYDWICENVTYDYENLNNSDYMLKYSAYAALIDKTAVCQGYALLLYRLALEMGIDCRIIVGIGNGGGHAWNIIKIGKTYYNLDATWDAGMPVYYCFLLNDEEFADHTRNEEYASESFYAAYPMAEESYTEAVPEELGSVTLSTATYTYNGKTRKPSVTVKDSNGNILTKGTDYTVTYSSGRKNVGTYKVTVKGIGNYTGTITKKFKIVAKSIEDFTAALSATKYIYNADKIRKPSVTVTDANGNELVKGEDYSLTYASGRKEVGRYRVTIKGTGNYTGTVKKYFTIVPAAPSSAKAVLYGHDDVKFSWSAVSGATGYKVYYKKASAEKYTFLKSTTNTYVKKADLLDGVKYQFKVIPYFTPEGSSTKYYSGLAYKIASVYTLKKLSTPTISKYNSTKVKVKWTDISGQSGYQISKSMSKTKTNIISTYATTSGTQKVLTVKTGVTYYYKVRAYKTVNGEKIYGPWSELKKYKLN